MKLQSFQTTEEGELYKAEEEAQGEVIMFIQTSVFFVDICGTMRESFYMQEKLKFFKAMKDWAGANIGRGDL